MRIVISVFSLVILTGCAAPLHAIRASARLSCTDALGTPLPAEQHYTDTCPLGPTPEQQSRQDVGSVAVSNTQVFTPQGQYSVSQLGNSVSISRVGRAGGRGR